MLIYQQFMEVYGQAFDAPWSDLYLTRADFEAENKKKLNNLRLLGRDEQKNKAYAYLLDRAQAMLTAKPNLPLLSLFFDALASDDSPFSPNVAYDTLTRLLIINTAHQSNAHQLATMGRVFLDSPIAFAAFLRFLCLRQVSAQSILNMHLLQDFFSYHLNALGRDKHPMGQLYTLLHSTPETTELAETASHIPSQERGFTTYCLNGEKTISTATAPLEKIVTPPFFTPHPDNLSNLLAIFGVDFMLASLSQWSTHKRHNVWVQWTTERLNHPERRGELRYILSKLYEQPTLKPALAELLNWQTLQELLELKDGHILCLIPYVPALGQAAEVHDLVDYLDQIKLRSTSKECLIEGLIELFDACKHTNQAAARTIMESLLGVILETLYVLDDANIVKKLRKSGLFSDCVQTHLNQLDSSLRQFIHAQTQAPIENLDYVTIEDIWRSMLQKIHALEAIIEFDTPCPGDKHQLQMLIAKAFYAANPDAFDFILLAQSFGISPEFSHHQVTLYERYIIELVVTIDHEAYRHQWISLLDQACNLPEGGFMRNWRSFSYGQLSLYHKAVVSNNLGLIRYLNTYGIKPKPSFETLAVDAARHKHWSITLWIHEHYPLPVVHTNMLLDLAVKQSSPSAINLMWSHQLRKPTQNQIDQSFSFAVKNGDTAVIQAMFHHLKKPKDATLARAFKQALRLGHTQTALVMVQSHPSKQLLADMNDSVIKAARTYQCEHLKSFLPLCHLSLVETALLAAARANCLPAIKVILGNRLLPREKVVEKVELEAQKHKRATVVKYIRGWRDTFWVQRKKNWNPNTIAHLNSCGLLTEPSILIHKIGFFNNRQTEFKLSKPTKIIRQVTL